MQLSSERAPPMDQVNFDDVEVSGAELAAWCGVSPKRIDQLLAEGVVHREAKGRYKLKGNIAAVFRWLRSDQRRSARSEADAEWRRQRTREIELRVAERERQLVPFDWAIEVVDVTIGFLRSEIGSVPAKVTRDLVVRRQIDAALNEILSRVVNKLGAEADRIQRGGRNGTP
jgi:phage terminase Nu1 subunit (DNA packaging protein)